MKTRTGILLGVLAMLLVIAAKPAPIPPFRLMWDGVSGAEYYTAYSNNSPFANTLDTQLSFTPTYIGYIEFFVTESQGGIESSPSNVVKGYMTKLKGKWHFDLIP